jgi:flap endonuclease-1
LGAYTLTNDFGETTSHLQGMFYRTIRMLANGLKPVFVFDGKPPELKSGELARRKKNKEKAVEELENATDEGDKEQIKKLNKRTVRVTPEMNAEAKKLLRLMGVPVIEAPCEAEAQCAALNKAGKVFAAGSEDMDTLTCGAKVLLRHLTYAEARKEPIMEIHLDKVLKGLDLTMDQFIDLCILLGCDYADKIKGVGPKRALEFIKKYGSIEKIISSLDKDKFQIPENFPYEEIRAYFKNPEVTPPEECDLTFSDPDEEGLIQFLCKEKGFSEERVKSGIEKIRKSKSKAVQARITSFFTVKPAETPSSPSKDTKDTTGKNANGKTTATPTKPGSPTKKRKLEAGAKSSPAKKAKT